VASGAGSGRDTVTILIGSSLTVPDAAARDTFDVRHRKTAGEFDVDAAGCESRAGVAKVR
jgi:hypothetical protein